MHFFKTYKYRKIFFILCIVVSLVSFGLFFAFYNSANKYLEIEKQIYTTEAAFNESSVINPQIPIFKTFWVLSSVLWLTIIIIAIYSLILLIKQKNNTSLLIKINIILLVLVIILVSVLLSFQPPIDERDETKIIYPPNYISGWLLFAFSVVVAIFGIFSLKNYGYLIKNEKEN
ncbi:hypothetical protein, partial [Mycoplasma sp. Z386]